MPRQFRATPTVRGANMPPGLQDHLQLNRKLQNLIDWDAYDPAGNYDDMLDGAGSPRPAARELAARLGALTPRELVNRQQAAEQAIISMGITFTVYSEGQNIDRAWPFDIVPRTLDRTEWSRIEVGLKQRLRALNHFIDDVYHEQRARRTASGRTFAAPTWSATRTAPCTCSRITCGCRPVFRTCSKTVP